jgi:Acyltransferase family
MTEHISDSPSSVKLSINQTAGRLLSLDLLKAVSITAVVSFHSLIFPKTAYASIQLPLEMIFSPLKFCVPVLFTISFFLFERGLAKHTESNWLAIKKRVIRLLIPTIFWTFIAGSLKLINGNSLFEIMDATRQGRIFEGAYFLLVSIQFLPVMIMSRYLFSKPRNVVLAVLLQAVVFICIYAIPFSSYHEQALSVLRIIDRPLFIYWFVYMALGVFFVKKWPLIVKLSSKISFKNKILLFTINCLIEIIEYRNLFIRFQGEIPPFDYVMFSCISGIFVMFLCFASIQENELPSFLKRLIMTLSAYSLGIFCINGILYQISLSISDRFFSEITLNLPEAIILKLLAWVVLLTASLGLSILLDRIGLKAVVR